MNPPIADALNEQINKIFNIAFLYLSCSVDLKEYGMNGTGSWMRLQYHSECSHALGLLDYMGQRRVAVKMPHISPANYVWEDPSDLFRITWEHEKIITTALNNLLALCRSEQDFATEQRLFPIMHRQIEREGHLGGILRNLLRCGKDACALLCLDEIIGRTTRNITAQPFHWE